MEFLPLTCCLRYYKFCTKNSAGSRPPKGVSTTFPPCATPSISQPPRHRYRFRAPVYTFWLTGTPMSSRHVTKRHNKIGWDVSTSKRKHELHNQVLSPDQPQGHRDMILHSVTLTLTLAWVSEITVLDSSLPGWYTYRTKTTMIWDKTTACMYIPDITTVKTHL